MKLSGWRHTEALEHRTMGYFAKMMKNISVTYYPDDARIILAADRWNCTYHLIFIPKYRRKVMDDPDKEQQTEVRHLLAKIERLEKENLEIARQRDETEDRLKERTQQYYAAATELEEERGKIPEWYLNEVNYDGTAKALAFLECVRSFSWQDTQASGRN